MRWVKNEFKWAYKCETPFGTCYINQSSDNEKQFLVIFPWDFLNDFSWRIVNYESLEYAKQYAEEEYEKMLLKCLNEPCEWSVNNRRKHIAIFKTKLSEVRFFQKTTPAGEVVYHTKVKGEPDFKSLDYAKAFCLERFKNMVFNELELEVSQTVKILCKGFRFKESDIIKEQIK